MNPIMILKVGQKLESKERKFFSSIIVQQHGTITSNHIPIASVLNSKCIGNWKQHRWILDSV